MTNVYLDMNALTLPRVTGIGKYCIELLDALERQNSAHQEYSFTPIIKLSRLKHYAKVSKRLRQNPRIFGWPHLGSTGPKIYHGLDFRVPSSKSFKKVVTIHDLISFERVFNEAYFIEEAKKNFEDMLYKGNPDHFICISEFTRQRFATHYPDLAAKTSVVPLGCNHNVNLHEEERSSILKKATLPERFILYLGTVEYRKNASMVVHAFDKIASRFPNVHLVVAGAKGFRGEEAIKAMKYSAFRERIHHLSYVSDSLVELLYQKAEVFVFPSLFEGFGLPVLEAMKRGCPVVTSKGGATEEVAGDAALLVDAQNVDSVAEGIYNLLTQSDLRQNLIELGWNRSQQYTWERTAIETMKIYKQLVP